MANKRDPYTVLHDTPSVICDERTGQVYLNKAKFAQKLFWLTSTPADKIVAANASDLIGLTPPADQGGAGGVEVQQLFAKSTGAFAVELYDTALGRRLMNQPVESTLVFGNAEFPGRLPGTIMVPSTMTLDVKVTNLTGAPNTINVVGCGSQIADPRMLGAVDEAAAQNAALHRNAHPYWLTFNDGAQVSVGASATSTFVMQVPQGSSFEAHSLLFRSTGAFDVEILEGNRRSLMNAAVDSTMIGVHTRAVTGLTGNLLPAASQVNPLPQTHLFQGNTQVIFRFTDTSGAPNTISVAWAGMLLGQQVAQGAHALPVGYR